MWRDYYLFLSTRQLIFHGCQAWYLFYYIMEVFF